MTELEKKIWDILEKVDQQTKFWDLGFPSETMIKELAKEFETAELYKKNIESISDTEINERADNWAEKNFLPGLKSTQRVSWRMGFMQCLDFIRKGKC